MDRRTKVVAACGIVLALLIGFLYVVPARSAELSTAECRDPSGPDVILCEIRLGADVHHGIAGTLVASKADEGKLTTSAEGKLSVIAKANVSGGINTSVMVWYTDPPAICAAGWEPLGYQAWWADTGQDFRFESRHAHWDDFCTPVNNVIVTPSPTLTLRLAGQVHNQPAGAKITRMRAKYYTTTGGPGTDIWVCTPSSHPVAKGCPAVWPTIDAQGDASWISNPVIDTAKLARMRIEIRWGLYVEQPNRKVQLLSNRWEMCNGDCSPVVRPDGWQGNGAWYEKDTNPGYVDSRVYP